MSDERKLGGCLTAWLWLMLIGSGYSAVMNIGVLLVGEADEYTPAWSSIALSVVAVAMFFCVYGVFNWKKWGAYGALAMAGVAFIINGVLSAEQMVPLPYWLAGLIGPLIFYLLVRPHLSEFE